MNEDLSLLISVVEKIAPTLAGLITGPQGAMVVSLLETIFRVNVKDLPATISADPEAASKLQLAKLQHDDMTMRYYAEAQQAVVDDHKSAREREETIITKLGKRDWIMDAISVVVVFGFFVMCVLVALVKEDQSDHDILYMLIGQLTAGFLMVLGYYYGGNKKP